MTDKLDKYRNLQRQADKLRSAADRAEGAQEQLMGRLQSQFGVSTLKEAKAKLTQLQADATKADTDYHTALDKFAADWADVLEEYT